MTDNKNISPEEKKDLRHADMDKFGKEALGGAREPADTAAKEKKVKNKQKKKGQSDREKRAGVPLSKACRQNTGALVGG